MVKARLKPIRTNTKFYSSTNTKSYSSVGGS